MNSESLEPLTKPVVSSDQLVDPIFGIHVDDFGFMKSGELLTVHV